MKAKQLFFTECNLAGRMYYDADLVWDDLKIGMRLRLVAEPENRHDANAVQVIYDRPIADDSVKGRNVLNCEYESFLLGYLPKSENEVVAALLQMGWDDVFDCRISRLNPDAHYEQQVRLTIRIRANK